MIVLFSFIGCGPGGVSVGPAGAASSGTVGDAGAADAAAATAPAADASTTVSTQKVSESDGGTASGDGGTGSLSGLPCEIANVLSTYCLSCHGETLAGGAPVHLASLADLMQPSLTDPSKTLGERSVERMQATVAPMPPTGGPVSSNDLFTFESWVNSGMPSGTCLQAGADPFSAGATCSSNSYWTYGDRESPGMHPGKACIACHSSGFGEGPRFSIAGTLFPTGHEPDDCDGVNGRLDQAVIEITDANGNVQQISVNSAGNFFASGYLATPFTARVLYQGRTRAMVTPQTNGDCNNCHTQYGAEGAPGRIVLP